MDFKMDCEPTNKLRTYFNSKTALITGAGSGIGRELAVELSRLGTRVIAVGRSREKLNLLKNEAPTCITISVDLSDWDQTIQQLGMYCKEIDFLVNNAGMGFTCSLDQILETCIDEVFNINFKAPLNLIRLVAVGMKQRGFGSIVNVSSVASIVALDQHMIYGASKAALDMVTKVASLEMAPYNVRVNSVNPTVVKTAMGIQFWSDPARRHPIMAKIPAGRFAEINEVVKPIIFLLSPASSMMNGTTMPIDGGLAAS